MRGRAHAFEEGTEKVIRGSAEGHEMDGWGPSHAALIASIGAEGSLQAAAGLAGGAAACSVFVPLPHLTILAERRVHFLRLEVQYRGHKGWGLPMQDSNGPARLTLPPLPGQPGCNCRHSPPSRTHLPPSLTLMFILLYRHNHCRCCSDRKQLKQICEVTERERGVVRLLTMAGRYVVRQNWKLWLRPQSGGSKKGIKKECSGRQ